MTTDMSRRAVLAGGLVAVAAVASGCRSSSGPRTSSASDAPGSPTSDTTDAGGLTDAAQFLVVENELIAAYGRAANGASENVRPQLLHLLEQHRAHRLALSTTSVQIKLREPKHAVDLAALSKLEHSSIARLSRAARLVDGPSAAVLASIAASHAAHVVLLDRFHQ